MSKRFLCALALIFTFAGIGAGEARQIDVWGHQFNVDQDPTVAAPQAQSFKALADPEPRQRTERPRFDLDEGR